MAIRHLHTLVIGSGAAGLTAAIRLDAFKVTPIAVYTEGLKLGTSINTGSDKQTYYKLGMYGKEPDSPALMAADLMAGGAMHGDIALVEAALSQQTFAHLASLGVPFPHDQFGQYIGYKTDHDPKRRATSCGPYTSREMCLALTAELKKRQIEVCERKVAVKLLTLGNRCTGAVFIDSQTGDFEAVTAENVVFAVGGPGGLYETSVYPTVHAGAIGLALEAGAWAYNLAESQFGLASTKFRWNVSGSYMQVLPRFVSIDEQGVEREFLREYFDTVEELYDAVFLKGYQWPFAAGHVPGSSLIDIFVYVESVLRGRKVFLDFRSDPADLKITALSPETVTYLKKSDALGASPLERLKSLNAPAIELYSAHKIDLASEMLQVAVCAQHCNGGLAGTIWWESVNLRHLFPIGEVNGTHGVTRPGGTALNAGQVGAFRAAEAIAGRPPETLDLAAARAVAEKSLTALTTRLQRPAALSWKTERQFFQHRMSEAGAFVRASAKAETAQQELLARYRELTADGLGGLTAFEKTEALRNCQLCLAAVCYLAAIRKQIEVIGSRGGSLVIDPAGKVIHPKLDAFWRMVPEQEEYRRQMMTVRWYDGETETGFEPCHPLPETDGWFETVWKEYREKKLYAGKHL